MSMTNVVGVQAAAEAGQQLVAVRARCSAASITSARARRSNSGQLVQLAKRPVADGVEQGGGEIGGRGPDAPAPPATCAGTRGTDSARPKRQIFAGIEA